jgi:hypothetical protein
MRLCEVNKIEHRHLVLNGGVGIGILLGVIWIGDRGRCTVETDAREAIVILVLSSLFAIGNFLLLDAEPPRVSLQIYTPDDDRPAHPGSWQAMTETVIGRRVRQPEETSFRPIHVIPLPVCLLDKKDPLCP